MNKIVICLAFCLGLAQNEPIQNLDEAAKANLRQRVQTTPFILDRSMNDFSSKLFSQLSRLSNGNLMFSPFSLHTALSMTYLGSPGNSRTNRELGVALGLQNELAVNYSTNFLQMMRQLSSYNSAQVNIANRIFTSDNFNAKENFLTVLQLFFLTTQEQVDFGNSPRAVRSINSFVSDKTNGLIPDLLSPGDVDALTKMVLINAIYFKSNWKTQFSPRSTKQERFFIGDDSLMHRTMTLKADMGVADYNGFRVLEMPYENEDLVMYIVLPDIDSDVLRAGNSFQSLDLKSVDRKLQFGVRTIKFPRFKFSHKEKMVPVLEKLGVRDLFNPDLADLSDISDEPGLHVTKVIHEAKLEVNEEGSEAAAASAAAIGTRTISREAGDFIVDRPFIFVIYDKKFNVPLFVGRVVDPSDSGKTLNIHSKREIDHESQALNVNHFQEQFLPNLEEQIELAQKFEEVPVLRLEEEEEQEEDDFQDEIFGGEEEEEDLPESFKRKQLLLQIIRQRALARQNLQ